jgi:hypothetical protein
VSPEGNRSANRLFRVSESSKCVVTQSREFHRLLFLGLESNCAGSVTSVAYLAILLIAMPNQYSLVLCVQESEIYQLLANTMMILLRYVRAGQEYSKSAKYIITYNYPAQKRKSGPRPAGPAESQVFRRVTVPMSCRLGMQRLVYSWGNVGYQMKHDTIGMYVETNISRDPCCFNNKPLKPIVTKKNGCRSDFCDR